MTKQFIAATVLLIATSSCFAAGDYQRDIGDGYKIYRNNSFDIGISKYGGNILTGTDLHKLIGPLQEYAVTDDYIFAWHHGRNDWDIDETKEYCYVVEKATVRVIGPISRKAFDRRPEVIAASPIKWKIPTHPHLWLLLLESLLVLGFIFCYMAISHYWISIPLMAGLILLIWFIYSRWPNKVRQKEPDSMNV